MQNIDRLALIVAAILVILGIAWAHLREDVGASYASDIKDYTEQIDELRDSQSVDLPAPTDPSEEISAAFEVAPPKAGKAWSWYRRPARLVTLPEQVETLPQHEAPRLTKVSANPDAAVKRFVFQLDFEPASNRNLKDQKLIVEMRGESGEWADRGMAEVTGSQIRVDLGEDATDTGVYGVSYAFRLRSEATSSVPTPLAADRKVLHSNESELVFLPKASYWHLYSAIEADISGTPGQIGVRWHFWDFEKGEAAQKKKNFIESDDFVKGVKLWDTGWSFIRIIDGGQEVEIKEPSTRTKKRLKKNVKPLLFDTTPWEAPAEEDPEDAGDDESAEPEKADDDDSGSSLFGDD